MKKCILSFIMGMLMMGTNVALASDVYITQSGASLTANINQDGQTNKFVYNGFNTFLKQKHQLNEIT